MTSTEEEANNQSLAVMIFYGTGMGRDLVLTSWLKKCWFH